MTDIASRRSLLHVACRNCVSSAVLIELICARVPDGRRSAVIYRITIDLGVVRPFTGAAAAAAVSTTERTTRSNDASISVVFYADRVIQGQDGRPAGRSAGLDAVIGRTRGPVHSAPRCRLVRRATKVGRRVQLIAYQTSF